MKIYNGYNRLNENYSFDDIDSVCDKVRSYKRGTYNSWKIN